MSEPTTAELVERVREALPVEWVNAATYEPLVTPARAALTALQSRCQELERERDVANYAHKGAAGRAERAEDEVQASHERFEKFAEAMADEIEKREATVQRLREALRNVSMQANRHKRATTEREYLIRDLEFIEEFVAAALSEEPRTPAVPPAPDPALESWQGLRGTKHPKGRPEEPRTDHLAEEYQA